MGVKTSIYAPRIRGDIDLGYEPSQIDTAGNRKLAKMVFPGTLLPGQTAAEIYTSGTDKKYPIGTRLQIDERVFRYGLVGGYQALGGRAVANLSTAEQSTIAPTDYAVTATTVTITAAATAGIAANEFAGGYLLYKATRFYQHRIISNDQADAGNVCTLVLETALVGHGITNAVTTLNVYANPWAKVGFAGGLGGVPGYVSWVGWPYKDLAIGQYAWFQTWGPVNICEAGSFMGGAGLGYKNCYFAPDGAVGHIGGTWTTPYQWAGYLLPCTYWNSTINTMADGGHQMMLQICP